MSLTYRKRRDANEREIIDALKTVGARVQQLSPTTTYEAGIPDLLVGFRKHTYLLEVKQRKGKAADVQTAWHLAWLGEDVSIARTVPEALGVLGLTLDDLERGRCVG